MDLPAELTLQISPSSITKLSEPTIFLPEITLQLFIESKLVVLVINDEGIVENSSSSDIMEPMSCQLRCPVLDIRREPDLMKLRVFGILESTVISRRFPQICLDIAERIRSYVSQLAQQGVTSFHIRAYACVVVRDCVLAERPVGSNVRLPGGASESALNKLEMERFDDGELVSETCAICLEKLDSSSGDKNLTKMPCSHVFHHHCVLRWLKNHNSCPMCRCSVNDSESTNN